MSDPLSPKGKLDLSAVASFHADLTARAGQDTVLDLSGVTQFGALCLQACIAAAKEAASAGVKFDIINVPEHVAAQIAAMGFTPETLAKGAS